jgi:hypothetical protein
MEPEGLPTCTHSFPLIPLLRQTNAVHAFPTFFLKSTAISTHVRTGIRSGLSPSGSRIHTLYSYIVFFSMQVTCLIHLIHHDLITQTLFVEEKKLCSRSLCSFPKPLIVSLARPRVLFPIILTAALPVMRESKFHVHTEQQV